MSPKKVLIIINTYFQLLTALNIVDNYYQDCDVDLAITSLSRFYENIAENLRKANYVNNVFRVDSKRIILPHRMGEKIKSLSYVLLPHRLAKLYPALLEERYDYFLFHNLDNFTYTVFYYLKNKNNQMKAERFEEGFSIYLEFNNRVKSSYVSESIGKITGRLSLKKTIESVYLYHPEYLTYDMKYPIKRIPLFSKDNHDFTKAVKKIFDYEDMVADIRKVIIFEESFFTDHFDVKDYELFKRVINYLPEKTVSIKLHPRNKKNRFQNLNANVMKNSHIPWEVMQANHDYSNHVLVTISSGSVLASLLYYGDIIPIIFLYKLVGNGFKPKKNYEFYLEKVLRMNESKKVFIPESFEELKRILKELV